jgi:hypothetical protein
MNPGEKCCRECGEVREDTPLNFPRFRKEHVLCLSCVVAHKRRRREQEAELRSRKMAAIESEAIDTMLKGVKTGGASVPHSAELLEQTMEYFGGVNGFSAMILKQFFDSKPGSPNRTKLLEMVTRLVTTNADQGGSKKPLVMWSEDELQEELDARILECATQIAPKIVDARHVETISPHGAMLEVEEGGK